MLKRIIGGTALLVGTIIGAGMFGIPYAFVQFGFWPGMALLLVLGVVIIFTTLAYTDLVLYAPVRVQFSEIIRTYLGRPGYILGSLTMLLSIYGALLVYTIGIGEFISATLAPLITIEPRICSILFYVIGAVVILFGLRSVLWSEILFAVVMLLIILVFAVVGIPEIDFANFFGFRLSGFLPAYGILLFALLGFMAIPDLVHVAKRNKKTSALSITIGIAIPVIFYAVFAFTVVGVCGSETTPSAIIGFGNAFGQTIVILGAILGILAIGTSFIVSGLVNWELFQFDWRLPRMVGYVLALLPPLGLFLFGNPAFIDVMNFVGGTTAGGIGILIWVAWLRSTKHRTLKKPIVRLPKPIVWGFVFIFAIGLGYEILTLFT